MHNIVHSYLRPCAKASAVEDRRASRDEDAAASQIGARTDQDVVTEMRRMPPRTPDDRVLHDDARGSDLDGSSLRHDDRPEEHPAVFPDRDIAADRRRRREGGCEDVSLGARSARRVSPLYSDPRRRASHLPEYVRDLEDVRNVTGCRDTCVILTALLKNRSAFSNWRTRECIGGACPVADHALGLHCSKTRPGYKNGVREVSPRV